VFLVEAFDDDGRLLVEDEMLVGRDRLEELVREGKRMRRARKKGILTFDSDSDEDEDDKRVEDEGLLDVDDEFGDMFEDGIFGDDWEQVGNDGGIEGNEEHDTESDVMEEYWMKKAVAEGLVDRTNQQDVW
jgi:hypothetical protein